MSNQLSWADVAHMYANSGIQIHMLRGLPRTGRLLHVNKALYVVFGDNKPMQEQYASYVGLEWSRPVMNHFEDMTEAVKTELALMLYCEDILEVDDRLRQQAYNAVRDQFGGPNLASWRIGFRVMHHLILLGFDVFGLIESGQAIRKDKVQNEA